MNSHIRTPLSQSLQSLAGRRAAQAVEETGRRWPCTVAEVVSSGIVIVNFEVSSGIQTLPRVRVPIAGSEYVRLPIQQGDKGFCTAADVRLGGMTGLGPGVPNLTQPGNLGGLVFVWLGNVGWSAVDDPNAVVIYGPNGVILRDTAKTNTLTISSTTVTLNLGTSMTINTNGNNITVTGSGTVTTAGDVVVGGTLTVNGAIHGP